MSACADNGGASMGTRDRFTTVLSIGIAQTSAFSLSDSWGLIAIALIPNFCDLQEIEIVGYIGQSWKDYLQEQSIPRICSSKLSFNGIVHHLKQQKSSRRSITSSKKVMRYCTKLGKDSQGPIPNKTPNQALEAIQTMADHSHKWHDGSNSRKVSSGSSNGIAAIANKLDSLGRDMKNLKENVHAIQIGCETCGGAHLDKECPFSEDVKSVKEVKYGEFGRSFPNNNKNNARDKQLTKEYQAKADNEVLNSSIGQCKAIFADNKAPGDETSSNGTNELYEVSFISDDNVMVSKKMNEGQSGVLPCQLPLKELSLGCFTLPCTINSLNLYAIADLDMLKKAHMGTVENVLVKIDKFVFQTDFVIIDMLGDPNETMILGRTFLANNHVRINVFHREISLGIREDRIMFDINENIHHPTIPVEKVYMANSV
ncbi:MAK10-like protein [Tanacetum coccineum]